MKNNRENEQTDFPADPAPARSRAGSVLEVALSFLRLGCTSFGGPVAHLGYFRAEFVARRKWLSEQAYADLVALCQFLPGPASSQVGIALGARRAGWPGAFAAWAGFTLPSALVMIVAAYGVRHLAPGDLAWLKGLKIVAVAIVTQAVWGMAKSLCPDPRRATFAVMAAIAALAWPSGIGQLALMAMSALAGILALKAEAPVRTEALLGAAERRRAGMLLAVFFALLLALPALRGAAGSHGLTLFDSFYRAGALVFGGGHVVLPLLHAEVVPPGWVSEESFIAGYGMAQAVPGPLFTLAAYLGAVQTPFPNGWAGGAIALAGIFMPAFLLVLGTLPFWDALRANPVARRGLNGVNAGVVGILLAALYHPIWTTAIRTPADFSLALLGFALLVFWKSPPWLAVLLSGLAGALLHAAETGLA